MGTPLHPSPQRKRREYGPPAYPVPNGTGTDANFATRDSRESKFNSLPSPFSLVWAGEFGRTVYGQGGLVEDYGRDHHGRCFSIWLAGGGVTDDYGYNIVQDPVHIHDLNATLLHCLGVDHERLTYRFQGRDYRLTDVHGHVVKGILG